jgi:glutamine cyclotransferase
MKSRQKVRFLALLLLWSLTMSLFPGCRPPSAPDSPASTEEAGPSGVPVYGYKVISTYPHDKNAFTQGLAYEGGFLYEGTGLHGRSTLRQVALASGDVVKVVELPERYFGEGIVVYADKVVQLTWRANTGFVYDKESFALRYTFTYPTEGWGITHDGKRLIMSDGTSTLRFLNPETFREIDRIEVTDDEGPVSGLNELEYVNGEIYANVWPTDRIAMISPETGLVTGWLDLTGLRPEGGSDATDVLNGIAYDAEHDRLFVTGKLWPVLFEIEIVPAD